MPIYELKVKGAEKSRLVQAPNMAAAISDIVEAKAVTAERMMELQGDGVTLEKAAQPATDPAAHAPGGDKHKPAGPTGSDTGKKGD